MCQGRHRNLKRFGKVDSLSGKRNTAEVQARSAKDWMQDHRVWTIMTVKGQLLREHVLRVKCGHYRSRSSHESTHNYAHVQCALAHIPRPLEGVTFGAWFFARRLSS
ncbi:hypothetical protein PTI98_000484 [Pleurotus ostreatus]|nr:hypothetical protein PTI98_000484 [Pleurotus ostreatus]